MHGFVIVILILAKISLKQLNAKKRIFKTRILFASEISVRVSAYYPEIYMDNRTLEMHGYSGRMRA